MDVKFSGKNFDKSDQNQSNQNQSNPNFLKSTRAPWSYFQKYEVRALYPRLWRGRAKTHEHTLHKELKSRSCLAWPSRSKLIWMSDLTTSRTELQNFLLSVLGPRRILGLDFLVHKTSSKQLQECNKLDLAVLQTQNKKIISRSDKSGSFWHQEARFLVCERVEPPDDCFEQSLSTKNTQYTNVPGYVGHFHLLAEAHAPNLHTT